MAECEAAQYMSFGLLEVLLKDSSVVGAIRGSCLAVSADAADTILL